jgi:membrane protein
MDVTKQRSKHRLALVPGRSFAGSVMEVGRACGRHHVTSYAAAIAYSGLFAAFPMLVAVLSLVAAAGRSDLLLRGVHQLHGVLPSQMTTLLVQQVQTLAGRQRGAFSLAAVFGFLVALWAISGAVRTVMEALNAMSDTRDDRGLVRRTALSVGIAAGAAVLLTLATVVGLAGTRIASALGSGPVAAGVLGVAVWPLLAVMAGATFVGIYRLAPANPPGNGRVSVGVLVAAGSWLVFTILFRIYVDNVASLGATYGTLASAVVVMLYLYWSSVLMLVGVEIDHVRDLRSRSRGPLHRRKNAVTGDGD